MAKNAIAIIPARGGSKRIPKKNIKEFFGKPLIAYSIEVAVSSKLFEKVIVTTDDEEIAKIAKEYGADVPFLRPKELSDDFTGTGDVIKHAIKELESQGEHYEYICTIYATAPLLQREYLIEGYEKLKESDAINAFSATSMPFPIQRTFKLNEDGRCEMFQPEHFMTRSQDLEEAYQDAGQFYWEKRSKESNEIMFGKDSIPIVLPRHLVQDIDTLEDWQRAELLYESIYNKNKIEFLGYKVKIIYDDYNYYEDTVKETNEIEKLCFSLENQDNYYDVTYRKMYKISEDILYSKKEVLQIENKNIPLKYRLIDTIYNKIDNIYNTQNFSKKDIQSCIDDLDKLSKQL